MFRNNSNWLVLLAGMLLAVAPVQAQKMYKWVDEQGNITYQDRPPPEGADLLGEYGEKPKAVAADPNQNAAAANPVVLYSVPECDACDLVRNLLTRYNVPYAEKNAEKDREVQTELKEKAGQLAVPVLTVGERAIPGYSSGVIRNELVSAGYALTESAQGATEASGAGEPLSPEEAEARAAEAGEELIAETPEEVVDATPSDLDEFEEIPEDERIRTPYNP